MTGDDEYTASVMRRTESALADLGTLARQALHGPLSPARESTRRERLTQLGEFLPVVAAYAERLIAAIAELAEIPADDPRSKAVLPEIWELRDRLADVETIRRRVAGALIPEPIGTRPA